MQNLKIHFLNTIWSDAMILESNKHYAFVDTGSLFYYPMIEKHVEEYNIKHIDFILLTHYHTDHYSNIKSLIENYKVDKLYMKHYYAIEGSTGSGSESNEEYLANEFRKYNEILDSAKEYNTEVIFIDEAKDNYYEINFQGNILELYDTDNKLYKLYSDPNSEYYNQKRFSENFNSIAIFIKVNNNTVFLGGDATCSVTDIVELKGLTLKMLDKIYAKHNINAIDIYKSCHHGGGGTNTLELCEKLKAKYCIITNTARWLDNWPTYDNLKKANDKVEILPTDHQKYIFTIEDKITYEVIKDESLFLLLSKN